MKQFFTKINVESQPGKLIELTRNVSELINNKDISNGLITLYIKHTSASLLIQENADPDVLYDLENFFNNIAPQDLSLYKHQTEGKDDMPAHIKSALTSTHLSIPLKDKALMLGTWQGIFLFEHRNRSHTRTIEIHIIGE
jgi:secondary thiamine-phosphate synthase enzyme|tara:strand:+ start:13371 stop:13790 length:420 start_codon:yes stop_codon:yes gene_type:complete